MRQLMRVFKKHSPKEEEVILRLSEAFKLSWSKETAYPSDAPNWTKENPSIGQCAVTALVIRDELGGKIHKNTKFKHYWNELPSNLIVDLTKDQFETNEEIESEGSVSTDDILRGKRAVEARTKERYRLLKKRVKGSLKRITPTIFLLSSNAQAEYIQDIIEAIGLPEGSTHHFRYYVDYLHPELRMIMPLQGETMPKLLKGAQIIVAYLNQTKIAKGDCVWNAVLPVRTGILRNCYKTGDGDSAIAHFFFELREGVLPHNSFNEEFKNIFSQFYQDKYALLTFSNVNNIVIKERPTRIFEAQCKKFQNTGLTYIDREQGSQVEYKPPLMFLIEGLYEKGILGDKKLIPKYDSSTNKSYYRITEATLYYVKYRMLISDNRAFHQIRMLFPKEAFLTPNEYVLNIRSLYSSECWDIEPAYVEHGTRGHFEFTTITLNDDDSLSKALDCLIDITYETRRRMLLRLLDPVTDLLFAIGPVYLAATKILERPKENPWYIIQWPTIILVIYGTWFILKLVRNLVRGK